MHRPLPNQSNRPQNDDPAHKGQGTNPNRQVNGAPLGTDVNSLSFRKIRSSLIHKSLENLIKSGEITPISTLSQAYWRFCVTTPKESNYKMSSWKLDRPHRPISNLQFRSCSLMSKSIENSIRNWSKSLILDWPWRNLALKKARLCSSPKILTFSGISWLK